MGGDTRTENMERKGKAAKLAQQAWGDSACESDLCPKNKPLRRGLDLETWGNPEAEAYLKTDQKFSGARKTCNPRRN